MKNLTKPVIIMLFAATLAGTFYGVNHAQSPSQEGGQVLFTFGDNEVLRSEFEYVYNKNNINQTADYSEASLSEYLELYINFRLKVKEAQQLGLDTAKAINEELNTYRKQLAKSYLFVKEVTDKLIEEAYNRMKQEVNVSHIFVKVPNWENPNDTMAAYKKSQEAYRSLQRGQSFEKVVNEYSEDEGTKENGGNLGFYFTALQTFYPFETAAYNTPVGQYTQPVKTRVGYHLITVNDKRLSQGKIKVAHVLVKVGPGASPEQEAQAREQIENAYEELQSGAAFSEVVQKYSEDKFSVKNDGQLPEFGTGRMLPEFEEAAFELEKDGAYSKPVRTNKGWHIIQRISKSGLAPPADLREQLKKRIERDTRFEKAKQALVARIKTEYGFEENPAAKKEILEAREPLASGELEEPEKTDERFDKTLFELQEAKRTQQDFVDYVQGIRQKKRGSKALNLLQTYYRQFVQQTLLDYEEAHLEEKYPDFKALMKEYRDGILLFELTDKKVWSKAIEDTAGLRKFHEQHKTDYMWGERVDAVIYTVKDADMAAKVKKKAKKKSPEYISEKFNTEEHPDMVVVETGKFEKGQNTIIDEVKWKEGLSKDIANPDGSVTFVKIEKVLDPEPKTLEEAKGYIVSDYQEYLEKEWIKNLREQFPVKVNEAVFQSMVK